MKKVVSLLIAVLLMACAVVSVSAEISPTAPTIVKATIIIDAVVVPDNAGSVTPNIDKPFEYEVNSDGTVKLVASSMDGFKFTHWEFITGDFDIIEGTLTSPVLVIKPTGDANVRAEAHFVKEDASVPATEPDSKPPVKPDDGDKSPTTGDSTPVVVVSAVLLMAAVATVVLKKKAC